MEVHRKPTNQIGGQYILLVVFAFAAVASRLFVHVPNFTAVGALALFSGFLLPRQFGFGAPLVVMLVTDAVVGSYDPRLMLVVYGSFAVTAVMGWFIKRRRSAGTVVVGSLAAAVFFFIATNFAVWAYSSWYLHTFAGLLSAYAMGLPFFSPTLAGNLFYSGLFFGVHELLARRRSAAAHSFS